MYTTSSPLIAAVVGTHRQRRLMRARQSARGTGTCTTAPTIGPVWPERISRDPAVTKTVHNLCPGIPSLKVYRFGFALSYSDVSSRRRPASSVDLRAVPQERHASRQPLTGHALHGLSSVRPITHAWNGLTPTRLVGPPRALNDTEVTMKKFRMLRLCTALAAIAAVVVQSGAGHKF